MMNDKNLYSGPSDRAEECAAYNKLFNRAREIEPSPGILGQGSYGGLAFPHDAIFSATTSPAGARDAVTDSIYLRGLVGKLAQWQLRMSYNDSYFGEPAGMVKQVVAELARAVDPIYPPMPEPVDPLAGVTIYTATVPKATQPAAPGAGEPCHCAQCDPPTFGTPSYRMVLCGTCGNKRCPHATDHRYACTGSNEPGQFGSSYGGTNAAATGAGEPDGMCYCQEGVVCPTCEQATNTAATGMGEAARALSVRMQKRAIVCEHEHDVAAMQEFAEELSALAAQPAPVVGGDALSAIGELIRTQDNRITSHPVFVVEQKREYVTDPDYNDGARVVWVGEEGEKVEPHSKGSRKLHVHDVWEFVTACFTEKGCKDYLAVNGHNLREPRIYVHSGYRNAEWIAIRELLSARPGGEGVELEAYDAGLLSDFGGGDVSWWQDYIRAELSRAHDHYQTQVAHPSTAGGEDR